MPGAQLQDATARSVGACCWPDRSPAKGSATAQNAAVACSMIFIVRCGDAKSAGIAGKSGDAGVDAALHQQRADLAAVMGLVVEQLHQRQRQRPHDLPRGCRTGGDRR